MAILASLRGQWLKALLLGALLLLVSGPSPAGDCHMAVGWEPWPPYQFEDASGELTGLDVELVRAIAARLDCPISYQQLPWPRTLFEVRQGGLVNVAAGADKTDERQTYAYFSKPYRKESVYLYVRSDRIDEFVLEELEDIAATGFRLGITAGYHYGEEFSELMEGEAFAAQVEPVRSDAQNHEKLMRGRIDGFLADPVTTASIARGTQYSDQIKPHPMHIKEEDIHVMFSKAVHSPEMVKRFNRALEQLRESSEYREIMARYLAY